MSRTITMIDWILYKIENISRAIFHWVWRVKTYRKYNKHKRKEK